MIIARGQDQETKKEFLLLGLTRENHERMMDGKPIRLTAESHGGGIPEGLTIVIFYGEKGDDLVNLIKHAIRPETKIYVDPRLKNP